MAKTVEVDLQVNSNIQGSIAELKALKRQLKDTAAGSAEFKALYNQIDDLEDKIKSSKNASSDWIDSLEQAGGPIGALGASLNRAKVATQSFGGALKATGIGLIVSLVAGLAAAFNDNEKAQKKLQPLLTSLHKIFQGVYSVVEPLFFTLVDLATKALPYVSDAFKVVYSSVTAVFQSLGKLGSAVSKLISGDFKGAWNDAKSSVTSFSKNFNDAKNRYEKGSNELTKTEKENAAKRAEALDKENEKKKVAEEKRLEALKIHNQNIKEERERAAQEEAEFQKSHQEFLNQLDENAFAGKLAKGKDQNRIQTTSDNEDALKAATEAADIANQGVELTLPVIQKSADELKRIEAEKLATRMKALDDLTSIFGAESRVGKAFLIAKQLLMAKELAMEVSKTITFATQAGARSAVAVVEGTAQTAKVGFPQNIPLLIGYAAQAAGIFSAIRSAVKGAKSSATIPSMPSISEGAMSSAPAIAPQFNVVGTSGQNQIAQTLGNQAPIKAFVVSNDVTTAQSLDRNIVQTATLGD